MVWPDWLVTVWAAKAEPDAQAQDGGGCEDELFHG